MENREPIQVMIPFDTAGQLAAAYNRAMERATSEWVLFLDHDLFICNKSWYNCLLKGLENVPHNTGWITAVTNRIGNPAQRAEGAPRSHDLAEHCKFSKKLYEKYGNRVERCRGAMSGFFILTNKTAWRLCGGFDEKRKRLLGVDNMYSAALSRVGFLHYRMPGLYVYHMYHEKKKFLRW